MNAPEKLNRWYKAPRLTRMRIILALLLAVSADGLQFIFGWVGWAGPDQVIDFVTMFFMSWLLGFHLLFLPTFVVELIPVIEDLPTWTACTAVVIVLRKREQRATPPPPPPERPVIDI